MHSDLHKAGVKIHAAARWILLDGPAILAFAVLALLPLVDLALARTLWRGIAITGPIVEHALLVLAFLAAAVASREGRQLSLGSVTEGGVAASATSAPARRWTLGATEVLKTSLARSIECGALAAFFWASLSFVFVAFDRGAKVWVIPERLLVAAMPFGYASMLAFALARGKGIGRLTAWLGAVAGSFLASSAIGNLAGAIVAEAGMTAPRLIAALDSLSTLAATLLKAGAWPLGTLLVAGALAGAPIFCALGGLAVLFLGGSGSFIELAPSEAYALLKGGALPALPLFALAGFFLAESGAGSRLVAVFREFLGWLPGGEAVAAVLACTFLTTFTGANGVTILALGGLLAGVLAEAGPYKPGFARGLVTGSGAIGLLLPPSAAIIVYGVNAQFIYREGKSLDITSLFKGALIPGLILVLAMCGAGVYAALRSGVPRRRFSRSAALASLKPAALELLTPLIAAGLYFTGFASLPEIAAITALYLATVEGLVKRELSLVKLIGAMRKSLVVIGGTLIILAAARGLSFYLIDAEIPAAFTAWATSKAATRFAFLLLLNLALLIVGCLMDIYSAILVAAPLVIPLGASFGLHPVHLGVVFILNLAIGFLTPPVGMNLFLASYAFKKPLKEIFKESWPFFLLQLAVLLLVTYLPELSLLFL